MDIRIEKSQNLKTKPTDESALGFGNYFTDHMFIMNYKEGKGWYDARVVPYAPLSIDPAAVVLHYGQEVFEGLKAYRTENDDIKLFRPDKNFERLNVSNGRLCIPSIDVADAVAGLQALVDVERDWVPRSPGTSLYIRPFIIGIDAKLGVAASKEYLFIIILSPVGSYYAAGLNPVKIYVEKNYVRAVKGGVGFAKTGGNYAASLKAQVEAHEQGYAQVMWLDGVEKKYVEEVGTMNVAFLIGDKIVTPAINGSILEGITRMSCIELLSDWGYTVEERKISIDEVYDAYKAGELKEVFGTGTAAVISPVGILKWGDIVMEINGGEIGPVSQRLYDTITGIQSGKIDDTKKWTITV